MAVFAGAGLLSGLLTLALPETRGAALPRTLEEAISLGSSREEEEQRHTPGDSKGIYWKD